MSWCTIWDYLFVFLEKIGFRNRMIGLRANHRLDKRVIHDMSKKNLTIEPKYIWALNFHIFFWVWLACRQTAVQKPCIQWNFWMLFANLFVLNITFCTLYINWTQFERMYQITTNTTFLTECLMLTQNY